MVTIRVFVHTVIAYFLVSCVVIFFAIPAFILLCIPSRFWYDSKIIAWTMCTFYKMIKKSSLTPITYTGIENIPDEPVVFVANHQSSFDIPLLGVLAQCQPHVWLAKHELMNTWLLRFVLPRVAVLVDTSTPRRGMATLLKVVNLVYNKKLHVMIFPEGGRFVKGTIQPFFGGFVILTKKLNRPLVPVYIKGVDKVYPPDSWWVYRQPIEVHVGKPMYIQENEDDESFKNRVHQWFVDQVH